MLPADQRADASGSRLGGDPSVGSWATYGLGSENQNLPGYVVMLDKTGGPISGAKNWSSGYMPASYAGTVFRSEGDPILNLENAHGMPRDQQRGIEDVIDELVDKAVGPFAKDDVTVQRQVRHTRGHGVRGTQAHASSTHGRGHGHGQGDRECRALPGSRLELNDASVRTNHTDHRGEPRPQKGNDLREEQMAKGPIS